MPDDGRTSGDDETLDVDEADEADEAAADETLNAAPTPVRLPLERIEMPIYRPRHRVTRTFALAFVLAALVAACVVVLVLSLG